MAGYTKLFASILDSSVWQEPLPTKVVWIAILAKKDAEDMVLCSIPGLAHAAGVTVAECEAALKRFLSPDKYSRTREHEGRRLKEVPGGWFVLNAALYRGKLSVEERREYNKHRMREYRKRRKQAARDGGCLGAREAIADGLAEAERLMLPPGKEGE